MPAGQEYWLQPQLSLCQQHRLQLFWQKEAATVQRKPDFIMATILIVDDRPSNREFLVTLLGYNGHHLLQASDGAEALGVVRTLHPDLIIADILMPTMDGYEL